MSIATVTLSLVAGEPLSVSLVNTSTIPPVRGRVFSPSSTASIVEVVPVTLIFTTAVSQTPRLALSQILYVIVYVPGVVLFGTTNLPVLSTVRPVRPPSLVTVIVTLLVVAGLPFNVSLVKIDTVPPVRGTLTSGSSTASITDGTLILAVAVSHTFELALSQISYVIVYVPGVLLFGTTNLPVPSTVRPVRPPSLVTVIVTLLVVAGLPFNVSLVKIDTVPPVRGTLTSGSSTASITDGTLILAVAVSHTFELALSQISYVIVYVPGVLLFGTTNLPVPSTVRPVRPPSLVTVIVTLLVVAGLPFNVSLVKIDTVPPVRGTLTSGSSTASITDGTLILAVAVSHTFELALSQISYVIVYVPGVLLFGTTNLPVPSTVRPVRPPSLVTVIVTLLVVAGLPFNVSLVKIDTVPPVRGTLTSGSSTASIVEVTLTFTVAILEQAVEMFLSQIR